MAAGVTATGLEIKTVEQITAEIFNAQLSFLGADLDASPDQPLGQLNGIVATKAAELWELGQTAYNAFNPASAEGVLLDVIGSLRGVPRLPGTYGTVALNVTLTAGTTLVANVATANVSGQPSNRWTITNSFTAPADGVYLKLFRAVNSGPQKANASTVTEITTAVSGWSAVSNPSPANFGRDVETDTAYRIRQAGQLAATGSTTVDSLRADLLAIPSILQATIFENSGDVVNSMGQPPHSFEALIRDEGLVANNDIAQVVWDNKAAGIQTYGFNTGTAIDKLGVSQVVSFTRATGIVVNVDSDITVLPGWNVSQITSISNRVKAYLISLKVGEDVVVNRVREIIMQEPYVWDATSVRLNTLTTTGALTIGVRAYATAGYYDAAVNILPATP